MQDALGGKAIHAALRPLTNICSGLLALRVPAFQGCNVSLGPCVDGSGLARTFFTFCSIGRCSHVSGLLTRFI